MQRKKLAGCIFFVVLLIILFPFTAKPQSETSSTSPGSPTTATTTTPSKKECYVTIAGRVYDKATGDPVSQATVTVRASGFTKSATTGDDGKYAITGCPCEVRLAISASKPGYKLYKCPLPTMLSSAADTTHTHDIPLRSILPRDMGYGDERPVAVPKITDTEGIDVIEKDKEVPLKLIQPEAIDEDSIKDKAERMAAEPAEEDTEPTPLIWLILAGIGGAIFLYFIIKRGKK